MKHYNFTPLKQKMYYLIQIVTTTVVAVVTALVSLVYQKTTDESLNYEQVSEEIARYLESNISEIDLQEIVSRLRNS